MTNDNNNPSMPSASHQTNSHSVVHHAVQALQSTAATSNTTKHTTDDENDNYSQASYVCEFNNKSSKWECVKSDYKSVVLQQVMVSVSYQVLCGIYGVDDIYLFGIWCMQCMNCAYDIIANNQFCAHLVLIFPPPQGSI